MCMRNPKRLESHKDILVYKVFGIIGNKIVSPVFTLTKWEVGLKFVRSATPNNNSTWKSSFHHHFRGAPFITDDKDRVGDNDGQTIYCGDFHGAFHSFATKEDALKWAKSCVKCYFNSYAICECIIPRFAEYVYEGETALDVHEHEFAKSYASSELAISHVDKMYHPNIGGIL